MPDAFDAFSTLLENPDQFAIIEDCLRAQRGNVSLTNLQVVNAILYVAEHGCK